MMSGDSMDLMRRLLRDDADPETANRRFLAAVCPGRAASHREAIMQAMAGTIVEFLSAAGLPEPVAGVIAHSAIATVLPVAVEIGRAVAPFAAAAAEVEDADLSHYRDAQGRYRLMVSHKGDRPALAVLLMNGDGWEDAAARTLPGAVNQMRRVRLIDASTCEAV